MDTITKTVDFGLCVSCGVCKGVCPKDCITFSLVKKQYLPQIDSSRCISCGLCYKVCPVHQIADYNECESWETFALGNYKSILYAKAKNSKLLFQATSGGAITQIIDILLNKEKYQSAFLVEGYNYNRQVKVKRITKTDSLSQTTKSRYLLVSHEDTIKYILQHQDEKLIIVATGCACQGIVNVIKKYHLKREQYLIIGLFCDKTMTQGVVDFFSHHSCGKGRELNELYFRTKNAGGWPGNVRLIYSDGTMEDLPHTDRIRVKNYIMPERCLYCLDKLNRSCDISVGDNYIPENEDKEGSNSVIIRTEQGEIAWNKCKQYFVYREDDIEKFIKSQHILDKKRNYVNACMKGLYEGRTRSMDAIYAEALRKIHIGAEDNVYKKVSKDIYKQKLKWKIFHVFRKIFRK